MQQVALECKAENDRNRSARSGSNVGGDGLRIEVHVRSRFGLEQHAGPA